MLATIKYLMISLVCTLVYLPESALCSMEPLDQAFIIEGPIMPGSLDAMGDELIRVALTTEEIVNVDLIISSPGGEVTEGLKFISKMEAAKAIGITIRCHVPDLAASMAFGILVHCDERYVLKNAFLLWHHARVSFGGFTPTAFTADQLLNVGKELADLDSLMLEETVEALAIPRPLVKYHFDQETLHIAGSLKKMAPKFLRVYDSIPGLLELLAEHRKANAKKGNLLFQFQSGTLIYIAPDYNKGI